MTEEAEKKKVISPKPSIQKVILNFCGYTTAHGLGRLADGGGIFRRVAWSLFCIGALVMFVLQVYNLFVIYLRRPVSTVVNVQHESHVAFPAVTICNLNMIRYEKLPYGFIEGILEELQIEALAGSNNSQAANNRSNPGATAGANANTAQPNNLPTQTGTPETPTDEATTYPQHEQGNDATEPTGYPTDATTYSPYDYDYSDYGYYDYDYDYYFGGMEEETKEEQYEIEEAIRAVIALQNDSTVVDMGHQFEDLVFECSFRGYDCRNYSKYWRHLWDYRYGNCFTFNGGTDDNGKKQKGLSSHITGPTGGLKLNLFIEQSQYIPELSDTAGARVVIHDQGQIPFPNNEGYSVLPSRSTAFGIRRSLIERADPFGNGSCVSDEDLNTDNIYVKKYGASYSRQTCLNSCHADKQIEDCGCAEGQFPSEAEICNLRNSTTAKCLEKIQLKLLTGVLDCEKHCPTPCKEVQFVSTLSMGHWPASGYESILESRVKENTVYANELYSGYYLSENLVQVKIYYEQLNYEKVSERLAYEGVNLVADIGGQLGLWIGISVLTCCEFLELAMMIIQTLVDRVSRRKIVHVQP
ncbi:epithelial sodium channel subunit alpha-like [Oculina patagonica]